MTLFRWAPLPSTLNPLVCTFPPSNYLSIPLSPSPSCEPGVLFLVGTCDKRQCACGLADGSFKLLGTKARRASRIIDHPFAAFCASLPAFASANANLRPVGVDDVSSGLIDGELAGIMGLAFQGIANSQAVPFWQALVNNNQFTSPEFSFYITRFVDNPNAKAEEPGGVLTFGGTNSSLFQGNIDFQPFTLSGNGGTFWLQTVSGALRPCGREYNYSNVFFVRCHCEWQKRQHRQREFGRHRYRYDTYRCAHRSRERHLGCGQRRGTAQW
jgi:hypothetical protein